MKRCLADVNILLPLLVRHHEHHDLTLEWFDGLAAGQVGLCRFVQLALIRLLGNASVMKNHAISASAAWALIDELMEDERMEFAAEPLSLDSHFTKLLRYSSPTNKLVADAYLAAFALAAKMRITTLDRGFRQFPQLDLELLAS